MALEFPNKAELEILSLFCRGCILDPRMTNKDEDLIRV